MCHDCLREAGETTEGAQEGESGKEVEGDDLEAKVANTIAAEDVEDLHNDTLLMDLVPSVVFGEPSVEQPTV